MSKDSIKILTILGIIANVMIFSFLLLLFGPDNIGDVIVITVIVDVGLVVLMGFLFLIVFIITAALGSVQEQDRQRQIALNSLTPAQRALFEDLEARQKAVGWMAWWSLFH
jgi:amino acid transporter